MRKILKYTLLSAIMLMILLVPILSFAAETEIFNTSFDDWTDGTPDGWYFFTTNGTITRNNGVELTLTEDGYALIKRLINLEPSSAYKITLTATAFEVWGCDIGINIGFEEQYAEERCLYGNGTDTLELYVETNVDEIQSYILYAGLGSASEYVSGTALLSNITVTKIDEIPEGVFYSTLIGSIDNTADSDTANHSTADYNDIGIILFFVLLTVGVYLLYTGRLGNKFADRISGKLAISLIFVFALIIRIYLSSRSEGHLTDLNNFKAWAAGIRQTGLGGFYESGMYVEYPPLYMYVLYVIGFIADLLKLDFYSNGFTLLVELPAILCDLLIALFAFFIIKKQGNKKLGILAALFLLISPAVLTDSVVWGQIDGIIALYACICIYLISENKKLLASLALSAAVMTTAEAAILVLPVVIVYIVDIFKKEAHLKALKELLLSIAIFIGFSIVISLPMKGNQDLFYVFRLIWNSVSQYHYASMNAFNIWSLFGLNYTGSDITVKGLPLYAFLRIIITAVISIAFIVIYAKKKAGKNLYSYFGLFLLSICMFSCEIKDRNAFTAIILLTISAFAENTRYKLACSFSLHSWLYVNLYLVLIYKSDLIPTRFAVIISILNLLTFAALIILYLRKDKERVIIDDNPVEKLSLSVKKAASERLEAMPDPKRKMKWKDFVIMGIITVVYGVIALTNLGSQTIPETCTKVTSDNIDYIIVDLGESKYISQMKYYTGYCEGNFSVAVSEDDINYYCGTDDTVEHNYGKMFRWQFANLDSSARYISVIIDSGYLEFREISFFDENNKLIPISSVTITDSNGSEIEGRYLFDEQEQAPESTSYMTEMYFDEIYHARTAYEYIENIYPYEITHPPFGKSIISLGIRLFGMNPFGWRFMGALCGILMLPVLYILSKRIFKKTMWAAVATALFAVDFMHFSLTRIATIDSYTLFFILLMYLFMFEYTQHNFFNEKLYKTLIPLGLCGLSFAFGAATKWICIYAGLGLAIIFFYQVYRRATEYRVLKQNEDSRALLYKKNLLITLLFCVVVFIIVPVTVYCVSYLPYQNSSEAFGLKGIIDNQSYMFNYHGYLVTDSPHPYSSSVFSWPFDIRPVFFFSSSGLPSDMRSVIWCFGNPVIWFGAIAAVLFITGKRDINGKKSIDIKSLPFVAIAALCQFFPNVIITREMFIYHYFTLVPFLIIIIVYVLRYIYDNYKYGKIIVFCFIGICCALFAAFYPVITGIPISYDYAKLLQWYKTWPL